MRRAREYPRPLSVDGPHVGDIDTVEPALELSLEQEPAEDHLRNAQQLIHCADYLTGEQQRLTIQAACERIAMAMRAIGERRLTARSTRPHMAVIA